MAKLTSICADPMRSLFATLLLSAACQAAAPSGPPTSGTAAGASAGARDSGSPRAQTPAAAPSSSATAPRQAAPTSPACAPPEFAEHDPPPGARSLDGLVELTRHPDCTIGHVERVFGKAHDSQTHSTSYELTAPVPEAARVTIGWRRAQNREYLSRVEVEFAVATRPTVLALATRLGLRHQVGRMPVQNDCMDGYCPSLSFSGKGEPRAFTFYLADDGGRRLGSRNVSGLPVKALFYFTPDVCPAGTRQALPTPLPDAPPGRARELHDAVLRAAHELARVPYDKQRIEKLLASFGSVQVDHNELSKFSWVKLMFEKHQAVAPFCFAGFRYVRDRSLVCHIAYSNRHLYEIEGNKTHRLFLSVDLGSSFDTAPEHISMIELTLMPRDWQDIVF